MHRQTPLNSAFRGYVSGGSRSVVSEVDDSKLMQEMSGSFQHNESRKGVEAPQNYGFTSVVFDADRDGQGNVTDGAEANVNFMGGNRSFPVAGAMDDRRHRLYKLDKGDTAMFRGRDDQQQFHLSKDGGFWSAPQGKTMRMALVPQKKQQQQQQQQASALATEGGQADQGQGQQQQKERGQQPLKKDNQDSNYFVELNTEKHARMSGAEGHVMLDDGKTYVHVADDKKVYVGAKKGTKPFALVVTVSGPAVDVFAKLAK
jgi:phage gp45-like